MALTLPRSEKNFWHTLHTNTWGDKGEPRLAPEADADAEACCGGASGSEWGVRDGWLVVGGGGGGRDGGGGGGRGG